MTKLFALVDCNNFYVSCERVFNPKLENRPVIVLSNNDGCVVSKCDRAKQLGIKTGVPLFKIKPLVQEHEIAVFSSNYALYGDLSQRVMETLTNFASEMEVYSIDEAFLDLSGCISSFDRDAQKAVDSPLSILPEWIKRDLPIPIVRSLKTEALSEFCAEVAFSYGEKIRTTVQQWTGIPVSIGIATTKTLAKIANRMAKTSGQGVVSIANKTELETALAHTMVNDIWGIGRNYARELIEVGIHTALELRDANEELVRQVIGIQGVRAVLELRGISCFSLECLPSQRQGTQVFRTFGEPVKSLAELKEAVATYAAIASEKLRRDRLAASQMTISLITNQFKDEPQYRNSITIKLPIASNYTPDLTHHAIEGLEAIFEQGYSFKKLGISLSGLVPANQVQTDLFDRFESGFDHVDRQTRKNQLMQVIDRINTHMGSGTLKYAASGTQAPWKAKSDHRSQRYTTNWQELPIAKA